MKKILLTGAGGFLGMNLIHCWKNENVDLVGCDLPDIPPVEGSNWLVTETSQALADSVLKAQPSTVIHAAFPPPHLFRNNRLGLIRQLLDQDILFFEACTQIKAEVVLISSSAVYGQVRPGRTLTEEMPLNPVSDYGLTKRIQELIARHCETSEGISLCIVRPFNLIGPGQRKGTFLSDWLEQMKLILGGKKSKLNVHTLATSRDFVDVRDAAMAIESIAMDFKKNEVVNIASGNPVNLTQIIQFLRELSPAEFEIVVEHQVPESTDIPTQFGSGEKLKREWHWLPRYDWRTSVRDLWQEVIGYDR